MCDDDKFGTLGVYTLCAMMINLEVWRFTHWVMMISFEVYRFICCV